MNNLPIKMELCDYVPPQVLPVPQKPSVLCNRDCELVLGVIFLNRGRHEGVVCLLFLVTLLMFLL